MVEGTWKPKAVIKSRAYVCGHCSNKVASNHGIETRTSSNTAAGGYIYLCTHCNQPTYFYGEMQVPGELPGSAVANVAEMIEDLYNEARRCVAANAYTGCVMICRKILMHVAHDNGAKENLKFVQYVNYLHDEHFIPPNARSWVEYIKDKGNEANHEIFTASKEDAVGLLVLVERMLQIIYDLPKRVPSKAAPDKA